MFKGKEQFVFNKVGKGSFDVFLKLGRIESQRESWDIPPGFFFAGEQLCKNKTVAATRLLRSVEKAFEDSQGLPANPKQSQKRRQNPSACRRHQNQLVS